MTRKSLVALRVALASALFIAWNGAFGDGGNGNGGGNEAPRHDAINTGTGSMKSVDKTIGGAAKVKKGQAKKGFNVAGDGGGTSPGTGSGGSNEWHTKVVAKEKIAPAAAAPAAPAASTK